MNVVMHVIVGDSAAGRKRKPTWNDLQAIEMRPRFGIAAVNAGYEYFTAEDAEEEEKKTMKKRRMASAAAAQVKNFFRTSAYLRALW